MLFKKRPAKSKSPLKAPPLRVPGQALSERLFRNATEQIRGPSIEGGFLLLIAAAEWVRYGLDVPPAPWLYSAIALVALGLTAVRVHKGRAAARRLKLGLDGERVVGQYFDQFLARDRFVFHDVPIGDANIDHVIIGREGVFTIETKTLSKPAGEYRITVRNGALWANGRPLHRDPLTQAKAAARWLHNFFAEDDVKVFVQPVIAVPGWFVEDFDARSEGIWVIAPKQLPGKLADQKKRLTIHEVRALASALRSYIRTQNIT